MNERGNIYISRICLVVIIALIVIVAVIIIGFNLSHTFKNERDDMQNIYTNVQNILPEETKKDYTKLDEGIATKQLPKVEKNVIAQENSTIDGRTPCFYNPVIPAGFKAIETEEDETIDVNAKWGELNAYLYGLVIEDEKQNQFVWIPVENMEIFQTTDWQKNEPKESIDSTYVEPSEEDEEEYYKMYYKVKKYGGFYIGRYETGDLTAQEARKEVKNADTIGIKKYLNVYNYVPYKLSTINKREITGANELAINFAKVNNYNTVVTSVVYGVQWDAMLRFIASEKNNVNDSINWGNYTEAELEYKDENGISYKKSNNEVYLIKTGSSEQTKAKNIYDVAGNIYEWTKEMTRSGARIVRGGSYSITIGQLAAARYACNDSMADRGIGFRISFYIN